MLHEILKMLAGHLKECPQRCNLLGAVLEKVFDILIYNLPVIKVETGCHNS